MAGIKFNHAIKEKTSDHFHLELSPNKPPKSKVKYCISKCMLMF